jgi:hypothetical protein
MILGTVGGVGLVLSVVGVPLVVTSDTQSVTAGAGFLAASVGVVLLLASVGLWAGRESIILQSDGVLEYQVRGRCVQSIDVAAVADVTVARRAVTKQVNVPDGGYGTKTVHRLCIGPSTEIDRLKSTAALPHWVVLKTFPWGRYDELCQALGRFAVVRVAD